MELLLLLSTKVIRSPGTQVDTETNDVDLCRLYNFEAAFDIHVDIWEYGVEGGGQDDLMIQGK